MPAYTYDGHYALQGSDSSRRSLSTRRDLSSVSVNRQYRRGESSTRPPWKELRLTGDPEAIEYLEKRTVHGSGGYDSINQSKDPALLIAVGDAVIKARVYANNVELSILKTGLAANVRNVFFEQAEDYMYFQNFVDTPLVYDGVQLTEVKEGNELADGTFIVEPMPIGGPMVYAHGRIHLIDTNGLVQSSDHIYSHGLKDTAPLTLGSFTEGSYPSSGNGFGAPASFGEAVAISVLPRHPSINGHGELIVFHKMGAYTINPSLPRNQWADNAIQGIVLTGRGCISPHSTISVNGDIWYRSDDFSVSSFKHSVIQGRTSFGDKSLSREVQKYLDFDNGITAQFTKAIRAKNRMMMTCCHREAKANVKGDSDHHFALGLVVADFDAGSTYNPDLEFAWDGLWTGLRVCAASSLVESLSPRHLFISFDEDKKNRIYELREEEEDNDYVDGSESKIESLYVMEDLFSQLNTSSKVFAKTLSGTSIRCSRIVGGAEIEALFKPERYTGWTQMMDPRKTGEDADKITQDDLHTRQAVFYEDIRGESVDDTFDELTAEGRTTRDGFDVMVAMKGVVSISSLQVAVSVRELDFKANFGGSDFSKGTTPEIEIDRVFGYRVKKDE